MLNFLYLSIYIHISKGIDSHLIGIITILAPIPEAPMLLSGTGIAEFVLL